MSLRLGKILVGVLFVGTFGTAAWKVSSRPSLESVVRSTSIEMASNLRGRIMEQWVGAVFTPLDAAGGSVASNASALAAMIEDPNGALTRDLRANWSEAMASQLAARAGPPERIVELVESLPGTRWITSDPKDDQRWIAMDTWHEYERASKAPRDDPKALMLSLTREFHERSNGRIAEASITAEGCWARGFLVRSEDQLFDQIASAQSEQSMEKWFGARAVGAHRFRVPVLSLEEVLARHQSARAVAACVLVKTTTGIVYNWHSIWYWEPDSGSWQCHMMSIKGWDVLLTN